MHRKAGRTDILIVADQCGARNSGLGIYALEVAPRVARLLIESGYDVSVAVRRDAADLRDRVVTAGGNVVELLSRDTGVGPRLAEAFLALPARGAGAHAYYALDHKLPPRLLTRGLRIATIHDTVPLDVPAENGLLKRAYYRWQLPGAARAADRIVTVSSSAAERISTHFGVPSERIIVAPNGFDRDRFQTPDGGPAATAIAQAYGLQPGYFLFTGRLSPRKNLRLLVEAVDRLTAEGVEVQVVLAGPPGWKERDDRRLIVERGLAGSFRDIGYVEPRLQPALYRCARALLYPSRSEGFGLPVLEALACGTPVIVARGTTPAEIGGRHVTTVDADDPAELAERLRTLLQMHVLNHRGASPSVMDWLRRYSWDNTVAIIHGRLLPLLMARRGARAPEATSTVRHS